MAIGGQSFGSASFGGATADTTFRLRFEGSAEMGVVGPKMYTWVFDLQADGSTAFVVSVRQNHRISLSATGESSATNANVFQTYKIVPVFIGGSSTLATALDPTYVRLQKSFYYKVYKDGVYVATWKERDVTSDFVLAHQINSAGTVVKLRLRRPADVFGEGNDVDYGNRVEVWVADRQAPNGIRLFSGRITSYEPNYINEHVDVILMGYGQELSHFVIEAGESLEGQQAVTNESITIGNSQFTSVMIHKWRALDSYPMKKMRYRIKGNTWVFGGDPKSGGGQTINEVGQTVTLSIHPTQTDARDNTNVLSTSQIVIQSTDYTDYVFDLNNTISTVLSTDYFSRFTVSGMNTGATEPGTTVFASATGLTNDDDVEIYNPSTPGWTASTEDLWYETYSTTGSTKAVFNDTTKVGGWSPSQILRALIDDYNFRGGTITYTPESIDETGTVVSYTFNTNTLLEGIEKCLELAPEGWYWYVDQATNVLHFHQKESNVTHHRFTIGKDVVSLRTQKGVDDIINTIYFTGGETGSGILYKKYVNAPSVAKYGVRAERIKDQRVTLEETADLIADRRMNPSPTVLITLEVLDDSASVEKGYDIESLTIGEMIQVMGAGSSKSSKFNIAKFDESPFDYDLSNLSSIPFQMTSYTYTGTKLSMTLSTLPIDVNKRIKDIKRNLQDEQFAENPDAPL